VVGRAAVSLVFIAGFYVLTIGFALLLLVLPILVGIGTKWSQIRALLFITAICWVPAFLFVTSLLGVRRSRPAPSGRELAPEEAPELFALLQDLAARAETAPPARVMLVPDMDLSVTEHAGVRHLTIGAPLLARATVDELRAGLAHELGHFAFGDMRLIGFVVHAHEMFVAMLESTQRSAFADTGIGALEIGYEVAQKLANAFVETYGKLYLTVTRRSSRRAELAADELAAKLAGPGAVEALLHRVAREAVLLQIYRGVEVRAALDAGAMPSDPLAGFDAYAWRSGETGLVSELDASHRAEKTEAFDTHPALPDRLAALAKVAPACPPPAHAPDTRRASALVRIDLESWVTGCWLDEAASWLPRESVVARLPWADVPSRAYAPHATKAARELAAKLFAAHPSATTLSAMLSAVVADLAAGQLEAMLGVLHPELREPAFQAVPAQARADLLRDLGVGVVASLACGALLERGGEMLPSLGDPSLIVRWNGTAWHVHTLARDSMKDAGAAQALRRLASELVIANANANAG
jgi:Zn-dependent protease with chaperone function